MKRQILIGFIFLILSVQAHAGFFDPIIDPIQNFINELRDSIEDELERSRVGRELNRIIDDLESVAEIVRDFEDLASMVAAVSTPAGIADLAIQYGHDPDKLFDRFQERVENLENAHPGGGSGPGGQLSNNELAAALQSVLEEPPLPDGVHLGDSCIIDLTGCPDESNNPTPTFRAHFWAQSCYLEGVLTKKKINGMYQAVCEQSWVNTWNGNTAVVQWPFDQQFTTYAWQQCADVLLTQQSKDQFLASRDQVCSQRIAYHEIGELCLVDYTSCGYGAYGNLNPNRIGAITYGAIPGERNEFACEITYGNYALNRNLRDACSSVYVGDREVNEFLAANPEPVQAPVAATVKNITPSAPRSTVQSLALYQAVNLQPLAGISQDTPETVSHLGKNGTAEEIQQPTLNSKKISSVSKLQQYEVNVTPQILNVEEIESPRILPGNPLHFLKTLGQQTRLALTFDQERKTQLQVQYANTKLAEATALQREGRTEQAREIIQDYQEEVEELEEKIAPKPKVRQTDNKEEAEQDVRNEITQNFVETKPKKIVDKKMPKQNDSVSKQKIEEEKVKKEEIDAEDLKKEAIERVKKLALIEEQRKKDLEEKRKLEKKQEADRIEEDKLKEEMAEEKKDIPENKKEEDKNPDVDFADVDPCADHGDSYVCGSDGKTYQNFCYAEAAKIKVVYKGKCVDADSK